MDRLITVGELKNWAYCRRVVFFRRHMPQASQETFKMREAIAAQELLEQLETRRTLTSYGVDDYERRFGLWLTSPELGIGGKLDLLLVGHSEAIPVDFKLTSGDLGDNHRMQLTAYGHLVERVLRFQVARGFLYRIPDGKLFEVAFSENWRAQMKIAVSSIHEMDAEEVMPAPTTLRSRCRNCEYANFCADVW